jgi:hypothetical protein
MDDTNAAKALGGGSHLVLYVCNVDYNTTWFEWRDGQGEWTWPRRVDEGKLQGEWRQGEWMKEGSSNEGGARPLGYDRP